MNNALHYYNGQEVPQRLSHETRELARKYLTTSYSRDTIIETDFTFVPSPDLSAHRNYAANIRMIAEKAPLRLSPDERLFGSAPFIEAPKHKTPGHYFEGTSHTTAGFERVLSRGIKGLEEDIRQSMAAPHNDDEMDFLQACLECLDAMRIWIGRYREEIQKQLQTQPNLFFERMLHALKTIPENAPTDFFEAVQSLQCFYGFLRLCGIWSGLGRLDQILWPYLERDLANGTTTLDDAREALAHFWIKGTEWKGLFVGSGDAQHYQNVILGGIDENGNDVTTPVTNLILDIVEELHISDFPIGFRCNKHTSTDMLRRIARIQRQGGGIVSIYNEPLVIKGLMKYGFEEREARGFTNDGCWEVIFPGKTAFGYTPFDALYILQDALGQHEDNSLLDFNDFESLYKAFLDKLKLFVDDIHSKVANSNLEDCHTTRHPATLLSIFYEDCIRRGRGYTNRGTKYTIKAIHAGGLPDVANALYAYQKLVFTDKTFTFKQMQDFLKADWKGFENEQQFIRKTLSFYGNGNPEADAMLKRVTEDYAKIAGKRHVVNGVLRPVGISTFGRELAFAPNRLATAAGTNAHQILAANLSPAPSTDRHGPLAVLEAYCAVDFTQIPNGCPLDMRLNPQSLQGEQGLDIIVSILQAFLKLGGFYLQLDCVSPEMLLDAQKHPENYQNLSVRISGWSARFVTLDKHWQDMVIARSYQA
ncbi:MAG: hypothetical protein J6X55_17765 [Victivallales bacterium]|nr:hypothetical protein [Victivallales bacterium]